MLQPPDHRAGPIEIFLNLLSEYPVYKGGKTQVIVSLAVVKLQPCFGLSYIGLSFPYHFLLLGYPEDQ